MDRGQPSWHQWLSIRTHTLVELYLPYLPQSKRPNSRLQSNVTASLGALKGTLKLCVKTYHTAITNGETSTIDTKNQICLKWQPVCQSQRTTDITAISTTEARGTEYWIEQDTRDTFNNYLAAAIHFGEYLGAQPQDTDLNDVSSEAARALADTLYSGNPGGIQRMLDLLANVGTCMLVHSSRRIFEE